MPSAFSSRQTAAIGLGLLIAFFLPIIAPGPVDGSVVMVVPNLAGLAEGTAWTRAYWLYPIVAGLVVLAISSSRRRWARAAALLIAGSLPFLVTVIASFVNRSGQDLGAGIASVIPGFFSSGTLALVAACGLFAGSRARVVRPASRVAATVGAIGGAACLVTLGLSVGGVPLVMMPFRLLRGDAGAELPPAISQQLTIWGLALLVQMACLVAASVWCLVNVTDHPRASARARTAFRLWWLALAPMVVAVVISYTGSVGPRLFVPMATLVVKFWLWLGLLALTALIGLTELIVATSPPRDAE